MLNAVSKASVTAGENSMGNVPVRRCRSCWGNEIRHTETVEFFLDNGVPLDDIYEECMERGSERTKQLLESRKANNGSEEL